MEKQYGTLDLSRFPPGVMAGFGSEPLTLSNARILSLAFELGERGARSLLPPAMHPAIPAYAIFCVTSCPESPFGAFQVAEARVVGRAGVRPRSFTLQSYVDNDEARQELSCRWGYPARPGRPTLQVRHDRVKARVTIEGQTILKCEMIDREPISAAEISYLPAMHLVRNSANHDELALIQIEPAFVVKSAERGRPSLVTFEAKAWGATAESFDVTNPISATFALADVTLPKIRFVCDPARPATEATTRIQAD